MARARKERKGQGVLGGGEGGKGRWQERETRKEYGRGKSTKPETIIFSLLPFFTLFISLLYPHQSMCILKRIAFARNGKGR